MGGDTEFRRRSERQSRLGPQAVDRVLEGLNTAVERHAEKTRHSGGKCTYRIEIARPWHRRIGEQGTIPPQRQTIGPPEDRDLPSRERFAGVPLPLAVVKHSTGCVALPQTARHLPGGLSLRGTVGCDRPLGTLHVLGRDERGLPAHGESYILGHQHLVDGASQNVDGLPLELGVRKSHPWILPYTGDHVGELHRCLARVDQARYRRSARRLRCGRQGDVTLPGEQSRSRIETDPTRTGNKHLRPCVQVGEVGGRSARPVEGGNVGGQLDEIPGHEASCQTLSAEDLHKKPRAVATRSQSLPQRLVRRLHSRFHADRVGNVAAQPRVQPDQKVDHSQAVGRRGGKRAHPRVEEWGVGFDRQVGRKVSTQCRVVGERIGLCFVVDEEIERVDDGHVGDQIDDNLQLAGHLGKHVASEVVPERVLLPVHEMVRRRDLQRVRTDGCATVRRRAQPHHMRGKMDRSVKPVDRAVLDRDVDTHAVASASAPGSAADSWGSGDRVK